MAAISRDPVCHMEILREHVAAKRWHGGVLFSFCSAGCAALFDADPDRYLLSQDDERTDFQLIILGGGPAGLTAALYASIQRLNTLLIADQIGGQAVESVEMENYMGFQIIEGRELAARFRDQLLHSHFTEHRLDRATSLEKKADGFLVGTRRGGTYASQAVVVTTGMKQRMLGVPGEERLLRRGVSFSVVQDAERFHGVDIAIIGGGNSALQTVSRLARVGRRLFLIAIGPLNGDAADVARARATPNLTILEHTVVREILGAERVEGIRVMPAGGGEEQEMAVSGVFVEIGFTPDSHLAAGLVKTNERGEITINPDCSTQTAGLFAAGDVTTAYGKRVIIACGEGAKAALSAYSYLSLLYRNSTQDRMQGSSQSTPPRSERKS